METATTHSNHSRAKFASFGRIVSAAAFALLIGAFAVGSARADGDDHGHGRWHHWHHEYHGHRYYRGPDYAYGYPDYYYAPQQNYYYQPEPYNYGYYPPAPGYFRPPVSEGIREFFGL
jgi:hypothetical protein